MTNEQKLREIAYKHAEPKVIWNDGNMSIYPDEEKIESLLSDLTALISEHYYPKEFTKWVAKMIDIGDLWESQMEKGWILCSDPKYPRKRFRDMDELFNYWKENERC